MNDVIHLVVRAWDGVVVNAVVGDAAPPEGCELVERTGAAANAWIDSVRQSDGTYANGA